MGFLDKAKDFAGQNPDKAQQGLDAAENAINERTGGQHADMVGKAGDAAGKHLGLPPEADGAPAGGPAPEPVADPAPAEQMPADDVPGAEPTPDTPPV